MYLYMNLYHICFLNTKYFSFFFFFNDTATTEIYTLSLHDALPISFEPHTLHNSHCIFARRSCNRLNCMKSRVDSSSRSEEHTSELQSRQYLVCRLLLEKKKKKNR